METQQQSSKMNSVCHASYDVWYLPRDQYHESEYEDGFAPDTSFRNKEMLSPSRFAVADGVTMAYFSGRWASMLTKAYVESGENFLEKTSLETMARSWEEQEQSIVQSTYYPNMEIIQILDQKIHVIGGSATLNGLEINWEEKTYTSFSIGDSLCFHIRDGKIISENPPLTCDDFGYAPKQISTNTFRYKRTSSDDWNPDYLSGAFELGDTFLLVTDAIALWLLRPHSEYSQEDKLKDLLFISSQEEFLEYMTQERNMDRIEGDDLTVSIIRVLPQSSDEEPETSGMCGSIDQSLPGILTLGDKNERV